MFSPTRLGTMGDNACIQTVDTEPKQSRKTKARNRRCRILHHPVYATCCQIMSYTVMIAPMSHPDLGSIAGRWIILRSPTSRPTKLMLSSNVDAWVRATQSGDSGAIEALYRYFVEA